MEEFSKKSSHYWRRHWIMDIINRTSTWTRGEVRHCLKLKSEEFFASRFQFGQIRKGGSGFISWSVNHQIEYPYRDLNAREKSSPPPSGFNLMLFPLKSFCPRSWSRSQVKDCVMTSSMISYGMSTHHLDVLPPDHCLPGRISNFLGKNYKAAFLGKANVMGEVLTWATFSKH